METLVEWSGTKDEATALIKMLCKERGFPVPEIRVRQSKVHVLSSGHTYWNIRRIAVTLGSDREDALMVTLHEVAHYFTRSERGHTVAFWEQAWRLYHRFGVDMNVAHKREGEYMKRSIKVLHRMLNAGNLSRWEPCCETCG